MGDASDPQIKVKEGGGVLQGAWVGRRSCFVQSLLYFFFCVDPLQSTQKKNALRLEDALGSFQPLFKFGT